jgi:hypothetical protein
MFMDFWFVTIYKRYKYTPTNENEAYVLSLPGTCPLIFPKYTLIKWYRFHYFPTGVESPETGHNKKIIFGLVYYFWCPPQSTDKCIPFFCKKVNTLILNSLISRSRYTVRFFNCHRELRGKNYTPCQLMIHCRFGANFYFSNRSLIRLRNANCLNNDEQLYLTNFTLQSYN